ncbi:MAG: anthranilate synthase component II [Bacteroidota bacterium]
MAKILVIDNYDSFVFNIVHYLEEFAASVEVVRNNQIDFDQIDNYDKILLSPGPGIPGEASQLTEFIRQFGTTKNILGVCLGHQAIVEVFGGQLINLPNVFHGVSSMVSLVNEDKNLFKNLPHKFQVGRYHSWVVDAQLPDGFIATSLDENGIVMSFKHQIHNLRGIQFHPESVLTPEGKTIIKNWVEF